jgi:hypothetical protein
MMTHGFVRGLVLAVILGGAALGPQPVSGQVQLPPGQRPPFQAAVEGLLDAIADPTPERVRVFAAAHLTPEYRESVSLDRLVETLTELRSTLGRGEPRNLLAPASDERIAMVRSGVNGEMYQLRFKVSQDMPPKIAGITLERGGEGASPPTAAPATITADVRRDVLSALYTALQNQYVSADTARLITDHLRAREAAGAYADLTDPTELSRVLTADLRALNGDLHLSVRPAAGRLALSEPAAPSSRFGFEKVERLPGNVGYIEIRGVLGGADAAFDTADEVLRAVADADAVILDLRKNPGTASSNRGSILVYILSHFLPANLHILSTYQRASGEITEIRTLAGIPATRRLDVPLYVLVGPGTASGGEFLAFVLQSQGRATVVGQRTAGAGRMVSSFGLPHGFVAGVSVNRTWEPRSGRGWEVVGVRPDVEVPEHAALDAAIRLSPASGDTHSVAGKQMASGLRFVI